MVKTANKRYGLFCLKTGRIFRINSLFKNPSRNIHSSIKFRNKNSQYPYYFDRIPAKEGEIIGTVGSHSFDFYITDTEVDLKGFVVPERYSGHFEPWKTYVVNTFDYLAGPLRSQLLKENVRSVRPLGGKIDFDIDGKLVGVRFKEDYSKKEEYWTEELSIVYGVRSYPNKGFFGIFWGTSRGVWSKGK